MMENAFPTHVDDPKALRRLQFRWDLIIQPILPELKDSSVLDLASHDGRWAYAFADAGAGKVTAVEPRAALVAAFDAFPDDAAKAKVNFECAEAIAYLEHAGGAGRTFDIVAILGFLYHTMEHTRLFRAVQKLHPKIIVVDSEFLMAKNSVIQITAERTDNPLNAVSDFAGQEKTLVGTPSVRAMERFADMIGYDLIWIACPEAAVNGCKDYYREGRKRRQVCVLRRQDR